MNYLVLSNSDNIKSSYLQNNASDDEEDDEVDQNEYDQIKSNNLYRGDSSKMLIRKSTEEPVTHIPLFSRPVSTSKQSDLKLESQSSEPRLSNDSDVASLPESSVPFKHRDSQKYPTTLIDLFPFRDSNGNVEPHSSDDYTEEINNKKKEKDEQIEVLPRPSSPSSWSATNIFNALLSPKATTNTTNTTSTTPPPTTPNNVDNKTRGNISSVRFSESVVTIGGETQQIKSSESQSTSHPVASVAATTTTSPSTFTNTTSKNNNNNSYSNNNNTPIAPLPVKPAPKETNSNINSSSTSSTTATSTISPPPPTNISSPSSVTPSQSQSNRPFPAKIQSSEISSVSQSTTTTTTTPTTSSNSSTTISSSSIQQNTTPNVAVAPVAVAVTSPSLSSSPSQSSPSSPSPTSPTTNIPFSNTNNSNTISSNTPVSQTNTSQIVNNPSPQSTTTTTTTTTQAPPSNLVTLPPYPPQPFIVLKTKRSKNQEKVFINLLNIPKLYFIDPTINYFVSGLSKTEDKGGESCDVYDVFITDEETIHSTDSNEMGHICTSIIETINLEYNDTLDTDYRTPKIKGNYKSSGGSEPPLYETIKQIPIEILQSNSILYKLYESNLKNPSTSLHVRNSESRPISRVIQNPPPQIVQGWMKKEGHQFKTIKRRYFVLENGELSYYEKSLPQAPYGEKLKGIFSLRGGGSVSYGTGVGTGAGPGDKRLYIQANVS